MSRTPAHYTTPRTSINVVGLTFTRDANGSWRAHVKTKYGDCAYSCFKSNGKWHVERAGFRRGVHRAALGKYHDLDSALYVCEGDHHEGDD